MIAIDLAQDRVAQVKNALLDDVEFARLAKANRFTPDNINKFSEACEHIIFDMYWCTGYFVESHQSVIRRDYADIEKLLRRLESKIKIVEKHTNSRFFNHVYRATEGIGFPIDRLRKQMKRWELEESTYVLIYSLGEISAWLAKNYRRQDGRENWKNPCSENASSIHFICEILPVVNEQLGQPYHSVIASAANILLESSDSEEVTKDRVAKLWARLSSGK